MRRHRSVLRRNREALAWWSPHPLAPTLVGTLLPCWVIWIPLNSVSFGTAAWRPQGRPFRLRRTACRSIPQNPYPVPPPAGRISGRHIYLSIGIYMISIPLNSSTFQKSGRVPTQQGREGVASRVRSAQEAPECRLSARTDSPGQAWPPITLNRSLFPSPAGRIHPLNTAPIFKGFIGIYMRTLAGPLSLPSRVGTLRRGPGVKTRTYLRKILFTESRVWSPAYGPGPSTGDALLLA